MALLTKRTWDGYVFRLSLLAFVVAFVCAWLAGQWRFALRPVGVVPFWLLFRFATPQAGIQAQTIQSTPGARFMLACFAIALVWMMTGFTMDARLFRYALDRQPLGLYHLTIAVPPIVLMFCGAYCGVPIEAAWKKWREASPNEPGMR